MQIEKLSIGYKNKGLKKILLDNLNLSIPSSTFIALIGKNGSGKSTLIKTLCGNLQPLHGTVFLNNTPLFKLHHSDRAKQMAVVLTENVETPEITVYELVSLGRYPYSHWMGKLETNDEIIIRESIEKLGLNGFEDRKFMSLSDGEAQRALIARALCQKAKLIILDEPTSHLDVHNRFHIIQLLKEIAHTENVSILYSTHEIEMALQTADLFWLIDQNNQLKEGSPEDLVLNGSIEKAFNVDSISFNPMLGHFEPVFKFKKKLKLICDDSLNQKWMKNALARNGYEIDTNALSPIITFDNNSNLWNLKYGEEELNFQTINLIIKQLESLDEMDYDSSVIN